MSDSPYSDQYRLDFVSHMEEVRRRILFCLVFLSAGAVAAFLNIEYLMRVIRRPIENRVDELIFISPTEAFSAAVKVSLLTAFILTFPVLLYQLWRFISPAVSQNNKRRVSIWLIAGFFLFLSGTAFSYFIAIPAALDFLLGFGSRIASSNITLGKYTSFFGALLLIGGIIFELPVFLAVLTEVGIVSPKLLSEKRKYAVIVMLVIAAIITPTQDIFNMLVIALPMYILYEIGIFISIIIHRSHKQ
jgi:sec-independent protein translocase protein TatC